MGGVLCNPGPGRRPQVQGLHPAPSSSYQIVIPKGIREAMGLRPGQEVAVLRYRGRIEPIPVKPVKNHRETVLIVRPIVFGRSSSPPGSRIRAGSGLAEGSGRPRLFHHSTGRSG